MYQAKLSKKYLTTNSLSGIFSTRGGNRTPTLLPELDFESSASTYSATRAFPFAENWWAKITISYKYAKI